MSRLITCLLLLLVSPTYAHTESQADLLTRYVNARDQSSLTSLETKPWHMTGTFELFNSADQPKEQGTFEEWWASPTHWRVAFTSPSFSRDRVRDGDQSFVNSQGNTPYFLEILWGTFVGPLPHFGRINPIFKEQVRTLDKRPYDCLTTDFNPEHRITDPMLPVYCFEHGRSELRFVSRQGGIETVLLNRPGHFGEKNVALDLTILEDRKVVLHAAITALTSMQPDDPHLSVPADFKPLDRSSGPISVSTPPKKLKGPSPIRPLAAQFTKGGTALLSVEVGEDGHVIAVKPLFGTVPSMEQAAADAVQQWTFQPYTVDGKAKRIVTTFRVDF